MKKSDAVLNKNIRRRLALALALFLFCIYLFTYRGGFHSVDEVSMFAVTESMAKFGRVNTNQIAWTQWATSPAEAQGFFGADGQVYSKKGLALSLAQAPLYGLALLLPGLGMLQTVSILNAALTAITGLLIFMFLWRMDFSPATSLITALIFGLATIAFVYAKYLFSEPLAGFLLLLAAYMLFAYRQEGGLRHVVIAGTAAGFAVLARANNLFLLPLFWLYLLWAENLRTYELTNLQIKDTRNTQHVSRFTQHAIRATIAFALALAVPGLILLAYNAIRSGNPLQTGYDLTLFSSNIFLGFYKLLFSPLRGLFIYSPILILSLPGWWMLRRTYPAEAWLFLAIIAVTLALFSAWSSGEGLSWGSRFLVPIVPFFTLCLAPAIDFQFSIFNFRFNLAKKSKIGLRLTFYVLLPLSLTIQILGVTINPWSYLAQLQADFGGEFFLENTAALYDFRASQIVGQIQSFSVENSDLIWWQPWAFDRLAFGISLALILLSGRHLWRQTKPTTAPQAPAGPSSFILVIIILTYFLLARYHHTDLQFGPPHDAYTQALTTISKNNQPHSAIFTVAQYHYHVPMNRFGDRVPLIGFAQQPWPPPPTALPLLRTATENRDTWLVTIGFPPAAPNNATEQWLALNTFKAGDEWLPDEVRVVRFTATLPNETRPIKITLGGEIQLVEINLLNTASPGQALPVEFVWQPPVRPSADYNLFLQLLNSEGAPVAQHDSPPNGGYSPTSGWQAGQQIVSRHALPLPAGLLPGNYRLIAGLYNPVTGYRLTIDTGADFVELGNVEIIKNE